MSEEKKDKKRGIDEFIEKAITPNDGAYNRKDMIDTTAFESHQTFSHDYSAKKVSKLSKGFNVLFITAVIILIGSLLYSAYTSRKLTVIYAYQDTVSAYEFNLGYSREIMVEKVNFVGPYNSSKVYKGYHGKLAILAEAIQKYDAAIVICDEAQILELAETKYLLSASNVLGDDVNEFSDNLGVEFRDEGFMGMQTSGGINIMSTNQLLTFNKAEYITFTKKINVLGLKRNVKRFIKIYFDY